MSHHLMHKHIVAYNWQFPFKFVIYWSRAETKPKNSFSGKCGGTWHARFQELRLMRSGRLYRKLLSYISFAELDGSVPFINFASSVLLINRPRTLIRLSATRFLDWYPTFFAKFRLLFFSIYRRIFSRRYSNVILPTGRTTVTTGFLGSLSLSGSLLSYTLSCSATKKSEGFGM
jgi:hypothetical protein